MQSSGPLTRAALASYRAARRSGLLDTSWGDALFRSAYMLYKKYFEDQLGPALSRNRWLARGGHALDVGANIGYTALLLADFVEPPYAVHAFEPEKENVRRLRRVVRKGRSPIFVHEQAVGGEKGTATLRVNAEHHGDHRVLTPALAASGTGQVVEVPMTTIDDFVRSELGEARVSLVKIDVQGYEDAVFRGMSRLLEAAAPPVIVFEHDVELRGEMGFEGETLLDLLRHHGFHLYVVGKRGRLDPLTMTAGGGERGYFDVVAIHPATAAERGATVV